MRKFNKRGEFGTMDTLFLFWILLAIAGISSDLGDLNRSIKDLTSAVRSQQTIEAPRNIGIR